MTWVVCLTGHILRRTGPQKYLKTRARMTGPVRRTSRILPYNLVLIAQVLIS
jgi:hypothetical protein